jgi:hypothetical protein
MLVLILYKIQYCIILVFDTIANTIVRTYTIKPNKARERRKQKKQAAS